MTSRLVMRARYQSNVNQPLTLFVPLQLPLSPMMGLAIWIELANVVAVQCPHDADPREHRRAAQRCDQAQRFHARLPLWGRMLGLG